MLKRFFCLIFIAVPVLFYSCAKAPDKADLNEIVSEINAEKMEKCGDGIKDEWEECDFEGALSCRKYSPDLIGPYYCTYDCKDDVFGCVQISTCNENYCSGNGNCYENNDKNIECDCDFRYSHKDCSLCDENSHFDIDGECISNDYCTVIGCGNERKECVIVEYYAACICKSPWVGDNCEECDYRYYFENDECKSKFCSSGELVCKYYEKCSDDSGVPQCICKSSTQQPDDCSKCLPGYAWMSNHPDVCINTLDVICEKNPEAPANSYDESKHVTIEYSDENGWTDPEYCEWKCNSNYYQYDDNCLLPNILPDHDFLNVLPNKKKELLFFSKSGNMYRLKDNNLEKFNKLPTKIIGDVRILQDGNYYFFGSRETNSIKLVGIVTPEGREIIIYPDNSNGKNNVLTFTKGGRIFQGDMEHTFPFSKKINSNLDSTSRSITISDSIGNTFTIYEDGVVSAVSYDGTLMWEKRYNNHNFSLLPALDFQNRLIIPYMDKGISNGVLFLQNSTGFELFRINSKTSIYMNSVSVGKDSNFIICDESGEFKLFRSDGEFLNSITTESGWTYPPFILNDGKILFLQDGRIYFNKGLEVLWKISYFPRLIYFDNKFVSYAYGWDTKIINSDNFPSGDWPQYLHDSMQSGSLAEIEFVDPPIAPVSILPENSAVFNTNSVTFSWQIDSGDPEIKYTLLLRDSSGYDKVYAGPQKGLSTATVEGLSAGTYEWRVVSQDLNGALNVSEARTLTIQ